MKITRRVLGAALAGVLAFGMTQPVIAQQKSVIETIKERGVIKIGLSVFVPWSMRDKNGDLIGFELDVGQKLADDMGVEAEFIPTSWDGIIPALVAGNFDVIISGMTVTPQRNLTVNFSLPYAYSGMTILSNTAMTDGMSLDDYNNEDITFAARRGATPATVIAEMFPKAKLLLFDEDGASTQEVLNGNAHATMASEPGHHMTHGAIRIPLAYRSSRPLRQVVRALQCAKATLTRWHFSTAGSLHVPTQVG